MVGMNRHEIQRIFPVLSRITGIILRPVRCRLQPSPIKTISPARRGLFIPMRIAATLSDLTTLGFLRLLPLRPP